jgi:precorrin-2 methylase
MSQKVPQAEVKRHAITSTTLNDIVQSVLDEISDYRHGAFKCIGDCRQLGNRSN